MQRHAREVGGTRDRDVGNPEKSGVNVFECIVIHRFDGKLKIPNVLVSGNFDIERVVISFSQDPAVNDKVGVRHYALCIMVGWLGVGGWELS